MNDLDSLFKKKKKYLKSKVAASVLPQQMHRTRAQRAEPEKHGLHNNLLRHEDGLFCPGCARDANQEEEVCVHVKEAVTSPAAKHAWERSKKRRH